MTTGSIMITAATAPTTIAASPARATTATPMVEAPASTMPAATAATEKPRKSARNRIGAKEGGTTLTLCASSARLMGAGAAMPPIMRSLFGDFSDARPDRNLS